MKTDQPTRVRHPLFARVYPRASAATDRAGGAEHRRRLVAGLAGRVVEIGAGSGLTFRHYPAGVDEVIAVEPEPYLCKRAARAAAAAAVPVRVTDGTADALPLADGSVDAGVTSLVLCSVADEAAALAELRRVIRPGGELRFYEHVVSIKPRVARWQVRVDRIWGLVNGGCHINRDTARAIGDAGFVIEDEDRFVFPPCRLARLSAEHILGRARRP